MLKKSLLVLTMVLLAMAAGQAQAGLVLDDGLIHTINTAIDGNLEVYDGSTPPPPDVTTANLVTGASVGVHVAVGGSSEVNMSGGSVGQSVYALDSAKVDVSGGTIGGNIFIWTEGQVTLRGGLLGGALVGTGNGIFTIHGLDFAVDGVPVGYGVIAGTLGGNYWDEPLRRLTGLLESGDDVDNDFQLGGQAEIVLVQSEIPEPASILIVTLGGALLARRRRMRC